MDNRLAIRDDMQLSEIAAAFVKSGYFQDTRDAAQAIVKILAGREYGFGPFASMTGIYVVQGRPALSSNIMASAVKRSGRYDYRVREMSEKNCDIEFFERVDGRLESLGHSTFSMDDARKAGTKNTDKYPRNMLFARAMSNGVRWYCPDVFGSAVYTPEELGVSVSENGTIDGEFTTTQPAPTQPASATFPTLAEAQDKLTPKGKRYGDLTDSQLEYVLEHGNAADKQAAEIILDWRMAHAASDQEPEQPTA